MVSACLFAKIELLAKPTGYFGEFRLAGVIRSWHLADEDGIPGGHSRWSDDRYRSAFALRMPAQFGCDYTFEFGGALCQFLRQPILLRLPKRDRGQDDNSHDQTNAEADSGRAWQRIVV
jgi:hypothetical protein